MDDYLSKPLAMADLSATLKKWMPQGPAGQHREGISEAPSIGSIPKSESVTPSDVRVVDPKFLRETFGDDEELINEILQDFVDPARTAVAEIDAAFESRDAVGIGAAAHKLKSSSRSIGAEALADLCADLEEAGKADDWDSIENHHPALALAFAAVTAEIED